MLTDADRDLYVLWYRSTHLAEPGFASELDRALNSYRDTFQDSKAVFNGVIMKATIDHFRVANGLIIGGLSKPDECSTALRHLNPTMKLIPRYVERRKQAASVWFNLLHILVLNWSGYGGKLGRMHRLGLDPCAELCDIIDDLHLYTKIQDQFKPPAIENLDLVEAFYLVAIQDSKPSPRTNPLLWWVAVLIHYEMHDSQGLHPIPQIWDNFEFSIKLEALDHYARVLLFHDTFLKWTKPISFWESAPEWKLDVGRSVDSTDVEWVDQGREVPYAPQEPDLTSRGWVDFHNTLQDAVASWLVGDSACPMHEILFLQKGTLPSPRPLPWPPGTTNDHFIASVKAVYEWSRDPKTLTGVYPKARQFASLGKARRAADRMFWKTLQDEIEDDNYNHDEGEGVLLEAFQDMFPVGGNDHMAVEWDQADDADGTYRERVIYVNNFENIKVSVWVRREAD